MPLPLTIATYESVACCQCGMFFCITTDFYRRRRADRGVFYCPAGHPQLFTGESEVARLQRQLGEAQGQVEQAQEGRRWAEAAARGARIAAGRARAAKGRLERRLRCGVCPHCHRSFPKLAAHMKTKHPRA